jgi:hypothetical protein
VLKCSKIDKFIEKNEKVIDFIKKIFIIETILFRDAVPLEMVNLVIINYYKVVDYYEYNYTVFDTRSSDLVSKKIKYIGV